MVHGLEKFKEYFGERTHQYVFIGGAACDILMDELGVPFRATKDLDMVLIIEVLNSSFGETFWKFVKDGGYRHREKSTGENQFYRFSEPEDQSFPIMIELFSRQPENFSLKFNTGLTPIHIDESLISLSAILLNDAYYDVLRKGKRTVDGYSVIDIETVILFKMKAWLDLIVRKEAGEQIDSKDIKKHKNDVFRLLANVSPAGRIETADEIRVDIARFIERIDKDRPNINNLGIRGTSFSELMEVLKSIF
jgi:hypothetical protein